MLCYVMCAAIMLCYVHVMNYTNAVDAYCACYVMLCYANNTAEAYETVM